MFQIDIMSRKPVYEQLVEQIERLVLTGLMTAGDKLPSVRNMSVDLSINPNTIQKAYAELERRGVINSVPGRGSFISMNVKDILLERKQGKIQEMRGIIEELKMAGIPKEEILEIINEIYD